MGRSIAEIISSYGIETYLYDAFEEQVDNAKGLIEADLSYYLAEGIISEAAVEKSARCLHYTKTLPEGAKNADMVIEAVFEDPKVKRDIYEKLDKYCGPSCIFCSNTSGSNIFEIVNISHPERLVITHFFNPAYIMPLVEIVAGAQTSESTKSQVYAFLAHLGKEPVVINQYVPGFIVNRIATAIVREAGYMIQKGWVSGADIDKAIRSTSGIRYAFEGPLALYDVVGWDLTTSVSDTIQKTLCNDTGKNALGVEMIEKGMLGLKSGKGIYAYDAIKPQDYLHNRAQRIVEMTKMLGLHTSSAR